MSTLLPFRVIGPDAWSWLSVWVGRLADAFMITTVVVAALSRGMGLDQFYAVTLFCGWLLLLGCRLALMFVLMQRRRRFLVSEGFECVCFCGADFTAIYEKKRVAGSFLIGKAPWHRGVAGNRYQTIACLYDKP